MEDIQTISKTITSKLTDFLKKIERYNHSGIKILSVKTFLDDSEHVKKSILDKSAQTTVSIRYKRHNFSKYEELRFIESFNLYSYNVGLHKFTVNNLYYRFLFEVIKWCCKNYEMEKGFGMEKGLIKKVFDFVDETEIFENDEALEHEIFEELDEAYLYYKKSLECFFESLILFDFGEDIMKEKANFFVSFDDFIKRQDMETLNKMYDMMYGE